MSRTALYPKQVLMLVQNLPVPFDRRVWLEATTLKDSGYQVTVICPATKKFPKLLEFYDGIRIIRFPLIWEGRRSIGVIAEYIWSIVCIFIICLVISVRKKIHVVHFCNPPDLLFLCALPARIMRRSKLVYDQHDLCPEIWELRKANSKGLIKFLLLFFERMSYSVADIVISTNESYYDIAIERGKKPPSKVFIVRSSPRITFMPSEIQTVRDCGTHLNLAYLGTMGTQEGIDLLLEAVKLLGIERPNLLIRLDLVGEGPETKKMIHYSEKLNLEEITIFHGRVSDDELKNIIGNADIAINPDRPSEFNNLSSMNKMIEYMALGRPIIQFYSREGEITAGDSCVSVNEPTALALAHSINSLTEDYNKRRNMQVVALSRFQELCWETQASELIRAYHQLIRTHEQ
jgi:glycosyltransferase involved in cell wall biosynthesis